MSDFEVAPFTSVHSLHPPINPARVGGSVGELSEGQDCNVPNLSEATPTIDWDTVLVLLALMRQRAQPRWW